ncbi:MAG: hypothetical protein ACI9LY_001540 [Arenicella sp.]|jgi:hypothetical protein
MRGYCCVSSRADVIFINYLEPVPAYFSNGRVLKIDSNDIDGIVRGCFENCDYIGLDVSERKGVDIVAQGQDFDGSDNSFDTVISRECLEHNSFGEKLS